MPEPAWPFDEPRNVGVYTTRGLLHDGRPLVYVSHDADGDWQFHCEAADDDEGMLVSLANVVRRWPEVAELADLPRGWVASRESPAQEWRRSPHPERPA